MLVILYDGYMGSPNLQKCVGQILESMINKGMFPLELSMTSIP